MAEPGRFEIQLRQIQDYEFKVKFDWEGAPELLMDESAPLGGQRGPNASRLLAAAAGNCLSASLLFCLAKSDAPPDSVATTVSCSLERNEKNKLRVGAMDVRLTVKGELVNAARMKRCLELFEDFCVVTASIRQGIPVKVTVLDEAGQLLHQTD